MPCSKIHGITVLTVFAARFIFALEAIVRLR